MLDRLLASFCIPEIRSLISRVDCGGPLGQLPHLFGHDRKSHALLAGPGSLDGGIEGKQVGLFRDPVDHVDDLADVLGPRPQGGDRALRND